MGSGAAAVSVPILGCTPGVTDQLDLWRTFQAASVWMVSKEVGR